MINIRLLTPADADRYRHIRLEMLQETPDAFGSTYEFESRKPVSAFEDRIRTCRIFAAFDELEIAGVAGLATNDQIKTRHKAMLWGMYVRPEYRGNGVAKALTQRLLEYALSETDIEQVQLQVVSTNAAARTLYRSLGFEWWGTEKRALKMGEQHIDEEHLVKFLR